MRQACALSAAAALLMVGLQGCLQLSKQDAAEQTVIDLVSPESGSRPQIRVVSARRCDDDKGLVIEIDGIESKFEPAQTLGARSELRRIRREIEVANCVRYFDLPALHAGQKVAVLMPNTREYALVWIVPAVIEVHAGCSSDRWRPYKNSNTYPSVEGVAPARNINYARCDALVSPRIYFRGYPSQSALDGLQRALPEGLAIRGTVQPAQSENRGRPMPHIMDRPTRLHRFFDGYFVEISGTQSGQTYTVEILSRWTDVHGSPFELVTLVWELADGDR